MRTSLARLFLVIIIVFTISGCEPVPSQGEQAASGFLTYENEEYGIKIDYPADWEQTETDDVIVAFITPKINPADTGDNINLIMNDLSGQGLDLEQYNKNVVAQLKQSFPEMEIIESEKITLAGNPGHKIVYLASNLKFMQAWTIKNDVSYIWTYVAYPSSYAEDEPLIDKMLASFEITKNILAQVEEEQPKIEEQEEPLATGNADPLLVGNWRAYSERLYYDAGGGGATTTTGRRLLLNEDGSWEFGSSTGAWSVSDITADDWTRWGIESYGPARKVVMENWNNEASADGPIEGSDANVDFIWVIYHVEPPLVSDPGTVWIKFGH